MEKRANKWILVTVVLVMILSLVLPAGVIHTQAEEIIGKTAAEKTSVPRDKKWEITFNQEVDLYSITNETVYVIEETGKKADTTAVMEESGNKVVVLPPEQGYEANKRYTLVVEEGVYSKGKQFLKTPVTMPFVTSDSSEVEEFVPRTDTANGVSYQSNVIHLGEEAVKSAELISIEEDLFTFSNESEGIASLKPGVIFTLPPSEEHPFGWAKEVVSIQQAGSNIIVETKEPSMEEVIEDIDISDSFSVDQHDIQLDPAIFPNAVAEETEDGKTVYTFEDKPDAKVTVGEEGGNPYIEFKEVEILPKGKNAGPATLNGKLKLLTPKVRLDMKWLSFKRFEFEGGMESTLHASFPFAEFGQNAEKEVPLGVRIPIKAYGAAGASIGFSLFAAAEGKADLQFGLESDLFLLAGVQRVDGDLDGYDKSKFNTEPVIGKINGKLEGKLGVRLNVDAEVLQFALGGVDFDTGYKPVIEGEMKDTAGCFRLSHEAFFEAKAMIGKKKSPIYEAQLAAWSKSLGRLSSCGFEKLETNPASLSLKPGELAELALQGIEKDGKKKDINLPDLNVSFKSKDKSIASVDAFGRVRINEQAKAGDTTSIEIEYDNEKDPVVKKTVKVAVAEEKVRYESKLLQYAIELDKSAFDRLIIEEDTYESEVDGLPVHTTVFYFKDPDFEGGKVYVGSISRYTHPQWESMEGSFSYKRAETTHWVYADEEPGEHPYIVEPGGTESERAKEYIQVYEQLNEAIANTLDIFPTDVPDTTLSAYSTPYPTVSLKDQNGREYKAGIFSKDAEYSEGGDEWEWWSRAYSGSFRLGLKPAGGDEWKLQDAKPFSGRNAGTLYKNGVRNEKNMFYTVPGKSGQPDLLVVNQAESYSYSTMSIFYVKNGQLIPVSFSLPEGTYNGFIHYNNVKANSDGTFASDDYNNAEFYWTYYTWELDGAAGLLKLVDEKTVENNR